jgi:pimeloyl-ACP methyl ester carboxylesterase
MDYIADYLHQIIREYPSTPMVIVAHDLGVVYAHWLLKKHNCANITQIVQLDVGYLNLGFFDTDVSHKTIETAWRYGLLYQYSLVCLWIVSRLPIVSRVLSVYTYFFPLVIGQTHLIRPESAYTYFYSHLQILLTYVSDYMNMNIDIYPEWASKATRHIPTLFLYGTDKPIMFHDKQWELSLHQRVDGSKSVGMSGGHWFFTEHTDHVKMEIDEFLNNQHSGHSHCQPG